MIDLDGHTRFCVHCWCVLVDGNGRLCRSCLDDLIDVDEDFDAEALDVDVVEVERPGV